MDIDPNLVPRLLPWLSEAAAGIEVIPVDNGDWFHAQQWHVVVHNGHGEHAAAGTVVAKCSSDGDAELVAAALWALVDKADFPE